MTADKRIDERTLLDELNNMTDKELKEISLERDKKGFTRRAEIAYEILKIRNHTETTLGIDYYDRKLSEFNEYYKWKYGEDRQKFYKRYQRERG